MMNIAIVTGASSGLGKELTETTPNIKILVSNAGVLTRVVFADYIIPFTLPLVSRVLVLPQTLGKYNKLWKQRN